MKHISRRKALQLFSSVPVAAVAIVWTSSETEAAQTQAQAARRQATERGTPFQPEFFTPREYATVTVLADLIIPRDERSGSASDAGVPEFMDFMMIDQPLRQTAMRGGLAFICATRGSTSLSSSAPMPSGGKCWMTLRIPGRSTLRLLMARPSSAVSAI